MAAILMQDLKDVAKKVKVHGSFRKFEEADFYPPHEKRRSSAKYREIHKKLVVKEDLPCLICGVKHSYLMDEEKKVDLTFNPNKASQMETHHHIIEWSLANAIDVQKFNKTLAPNLKRRYPNEKLYHSYMLENDIKDWVDHHEHNLWVLCDIHHRHKYFGIHAITGPMWTPQNLFSEAFLNAIEEEVSGPSKTPSSTEKSLISE